MYTTIQPKVRVLINLFILFVHNHLTKKGPHWFILLICTRTFNLIIVSSFIYSFFSARTFDQKWGSTLIYFLICTWPFDQIIGSSFIYYFFSARPFDQKLGSSLIYLSFLHDHSTKIYDLSLIYSFFVHDHSTKN